MINVKDILIENDYLNGQNANIRNYWQDLADYCHPRKAWITSIRTKGERVRFNFLYDSTAILSIRKSAAGFFTNLTNPSSRWFALRTLQEEYMNDRDVQLWFKRAEDIVLSTLWNTNFYNVIHEFFTDYITFGTAGYISHTDPREKFRFESVDMDQFNLVEDARGRITDVYRNFKLTARQAYRLWGAAAGKNVVESLEGKPFAEFDFLHYVGPRHETDPGKMDSLNMPFTSVWINKKEQKIINESGFMEMPYHFGRFYKDSKDVMGFGPAMDVLPWIRLINAQQKTCIRSWMKQADPPLQAPNKGFMLPLNLNPGAMNYRDTKTNADSLQPLPVYAGKFSESTVIIDQNKKNIEEGFFVPLFQALSQITKQMTIPEIQRRVSENMVLLGPVVNRCTQEVLGPTIIRLLNESYRKGELPPIPDALMSGEGDQTADFAPVYLSPLAKAQRESEVSTLEAFLLDVDAVGKIKPAAYDLVNEDSTIKEIAKIRGISPVVLNSDQDIQKIREARQQQEQAMSVLSGGQAAAKIAKDMKDAQPEQATVGS